MNWNVRWKGVPAITSLDVWINGQVRASGRVNAYITQITNLFVVIWFVLNERISLARNMYHSI